jgi:hypothetical protein
MGRECGMHGDNTNTHKVGIHERKTCKTQMYRWAKGSIKMNSKHIFVEVWTPTTSG